MTIAEYIQNTAKLAGFKSKDGKTLQNRVLETTHIWSNDICSSYCSLAMSKAGFSEDDTARVLRELKNCYENIPIEQAEKCFK